MTWQGSVAAVPIVLVILHCVTRPAPRQKPASIDRPSRIMFSESTSRMAALRASITLVALLATCCDAFSLISPSRVLGSWRPTPLSSRATAASPCRILHASSQRLGPRSGSRLVMSTDFDAVRSSLRVGITILAAAGGTSAVGGLLRSTPTPKGILARNPPSKIDSSNSLVARKLLHQHFFPAMT